MRPVDKKDLIWLHDKFAKTAKEIVDSGREHAPIIMIATIDEKTVGRFRDIYVVKSEVAHKLHSSNAAKEVMISAVETIVTRNPGTVVMHISEAWSAHFTEEEYRLREANPNAPPIRELPNRGESLVITLHTAHRSYSTAHEIKTIDGKRTLELREIDLSGTQVGRLMLNPEINIEQQHLKRT